MWKPGLSALPSIVLAVETAGQAESMNCERRKADVDLAHLQ
jgi:hypothetical protein